MSTPHGSHREYTLEEYERIEDPGEYWTELSRGRLVREPRPGGVHSYVIMELTVLLREFVRKHDLGMIVPEGGFILSHEPPTVRGPDIGFIVKERLTGSIPTSWWPFAPDLAIEVLSPKRRAASLHEKILQYFEAGTRVVWVVDARTRSVTVYNSLADISIIRAPALLSGADVLPGLELSLDAFLPAQTS